MSKNSLPLQTNANVNTKLTIINSTLSDNDAAREGGAISTNSHASESPNANTNANIIITNSTLSGNNAGRGKSISATAHYDDDIDVILNNSLIIGKTQNIFFGDQSVNCLFNARVSVAASSANNLLDFACGEITNGINNNLIDSNYTPANQLTALTDNSCVTMAGAETSATCVKTMALQPTSAAINAGADNGLASDQRGFNFINAPDIGAYEFGVFQYKDASCGEADGVSSVEAPSDNLCIVGVLSDAGVAKVDDEGLDL